MESLVRLRIGQKGQMSIEFMMLVVLILVYINAVIQPAMFEAETSLKDTSKVAQARFAAQKLANSIDFIASSGAQSKETITLFVPADSSISCDSALNEINFTVNVKGEYLIQGSLGTCQNSQCNGTIDLNPSASLDCSGLAPINGPAGKGIKAQEVSVFKNGTGDVFVS